MSGVRDQIYVFIKLHYDSCLLDPVVEIIREQFSSVQFGQSVVSWLLWPHGPQHARPACPSPTPGVYPNLCPLSLWCHQIISSSVIPFSSCLQSFLASGSFQMSQLFTSGGQSIGVSASTSVLPVIYTYIYVCIYIIYIFLYLYIKIYI